MAVSYKIPFKGIIIFIGYFVAALAIITLINTKVKDERLITPLYFLLFLICSVLIFGKFALGANKVSFIILFCPIIFISIYGLISNRALFPLYIPANPLAGLLGIFGGFFLLKKGRPRVIYFLIVGVSIFLYSCLILPAEINKKQSIALKHIEEKSISLAAIVDLDGKEISLAQLGNPKVLLLDFWFIGCEPCMLKMKYLNQLDKIYAKDHNVRIVVVGLGSSDTIEEVRSFKKRHPEFSFTFLYDREGKFSGKYGFDGFPVEIMLDDRQIIRETYHGFRRATAGQYVNETIEKINKILNEKRK